MLESARAVKGGSLTVKRLEKMVLSQEQQLKKRLDATKDTGVTFEETGIDYVIVDEAHGYKNLATVSNIRDARIEGSKRASDLHMKLEWLRERHGRRVATMATATPIANSVTEAHVMQRYLRPDLLQAAGVEHFDAWAATFGQTVTEIEMAPTGGGELPAEHAVRSLPERPRDAAHVARVRRRQDRRGPAAARPRARRDRERGADPANRGDRAEPGDRRLPAAARRPRRQGPRPGSPPGGGQHAEDLHRRPQGRARHAAGRRRADRRRLQARYRRPQHRPPLPAHQAPHLHRPRQRAAVTDPRRAADRVLRPLNPSGGMERIRRTAKPALRARDPTRPDPRHPRGPQRRREGPPVRRLPQRTCLRARRLDREDGRRHQHPDPSDRASPPRLPMAARRHRTTRRPHPPPGQPEQPSRDLPLRRRAELRRLLLADRRAQSEIHQPGHTRPTRRPPDRRHRREHPLLHRGQGARLRRPAAARARQRRQRADQAPAPATSVGAQPAAAPRHRRKRCSARAGARHRHRAGRRRAEAPHRHPRRAVRDDDRRDPYTDRRAAADALSRWAKTPRSTRRDRSASSAPSSSPGSSGSTTSTAAAKRTSPSTGCRSRRRTPASSTCTRTRSGSCASSSTASRTSTAYAAGCSPDSRKQPKRACGRGKRSPSRSSTPRPWLPQSASSSRSSSR